MYDATPPPATRSEQSVDLARSIDTDCFGSRATWQAGHGHDFTADHHNKPSTSAQAYFTHWQAVANRRTAAVRVSCEGILGFSHTDWQVTIARLFPFFELIANFAICQYFVSAINALSDRFYFFKQAQLISV